MRSKTAKLKRTGESAVLRELRALRESLAPKPENAVSLSARVSTLEAKVSALSEQLERLTPLVAQIVQSMKNARSNGDYDLRASNPGYAL